MGTGLKGHGDHIKTGNTKLLIQLSAPSSGSQLTMKHMKEEGILMLITKMFLTKTDCLLFLQTPFLSLPLLKC